LRAYLKLLERKGLLIKYEKPVSTALEIASILRSNDGKPILFERVKGHSMPVVGNLYSSPELLSLALGIPRSRLREQLLKAISHPVEPRVRKTKAYEEIKADLFKLPIPVHHKLDAGPYITSAVVVASHEHLRTNASYHRCLVLDRERIVMRIAPRHLNRLLEEGVKEVAICIGVPPSVALSAAVSVELGKSELAIANALRRTDLVELDGMKVPPSEIVMLAEFMGQRHEEGPFLDLLGLMDKVRQERVFRIKKIFVKEDPIYQTILPGGKEHALLMGFPREAIIYEEVRKVCNCLEVKLTPGGRNWLHCLIKIKKKSPEDPGNAILTAFRVHPSLKHVWVVDEDIDINNPEEVEWAMATRFQGKTGMIMREELGSSLDPSAEDRLTTKVGFDLTIPAGKKVESFLRPPLT